MTMRRKEKEIKDKKAIEAIIKNAKACRLAISFDDQPYVVPLCFGYKDNTLFFHSSPAGKKIDIIRKNNKVCFEIDSDIELVEKEKPCDWSMKYKSVIGFGNAFFIEGLDEKRKALEIIMRQYSDKNFSFSDYHINGVMALKVEISSMTGKKSGYGFYKAILFLPVFLAQYSFESASAIKSVRVLFSFSSARPKLIVIPFARFGGFVSFSTEVLTRSATSIP